MVALTVVVLASGFVPIERASATETTPYPHLIEEFDRPLFLGTTVGVSMSPIDIGADGRYLFWSDGFLGAFKRWLRTDLVTGETIELHDPASGGAPLAMSSDGNYLLVSSGRPVPIGQFPDLQLHRVDVRSGEKVLVAETRALGVTSFSDLGISDGGEWVGFMSGGFGQATEVFRVNVASGDLDRKQFPDSSLGQFELADDGRYAVIERRIVGGSEYVRYDFATGNELVFRGVASDSHKRPISISADGRFTASGGSVYDSRDGSVVEFASDVADVQVSSDGSVVGFTSSQPYVGNDTNGFIDAYTWTRSDDQYRRVSATDRGTQIGGDVRRFAMSADASVAVFTASTENVHVRSRPIGGGAGVLMVAHLNAALSSDNGIVDVAVRPGGGVWSLGRSGEVYSETAPIYIDCNVTVNRPGAIPGRRPAMDDGEDATSISATNSGEGYWIFTSYGRVIACGDAEHYGDMGAVDLNQPVIDSATTPTGRGYYMVGADGGIFTFGDAVYRGSVPEILPGVQLSGPIVAITTTESNRGYRMVAADGGMFNFGDAQFFGSVPDVLPGVSLAAPIVEMVASERGYLIVGADGGIFNFGESLFLGSLGATQIPRPIGSVVVLEDLSGYVMFDGDASPYAFGAGASLLPAVIATSVQGG